MNTYICPLNYAYLSYICFMFGLFKKKTSDTASHASFPFDEVMVDMHSHLLPAIDDGSRSIDETIALVKEFISLGYKKIITTPHIMAGIYPNQPEDITKLAAEVSQVLKSHNIDIPFSAAAEHMLDDGFDKLLQEKRLLCLKENWVLVECSFASPPFDLEAKLFTMEIKGYQPVLAHPERYAYWYKNKAMFDNLKDRGVLFQLNLGSLSGQYGAGAQEMALYLIKKNYIDLVSSDCHGAGHIEAMHAIKMNNTIEMLFKDNRLQNKWLLDN
jgi:protein-tyrosine phosphatase